MAVRDRGPLGKVGVLPKGIGSLTAGHPPARAGTLFVMGAYGGMRVAPDAGFEVVFGRCEPDVHVCVGPDDPHVSRRHGRIVREHARWVLYNTGRLAIRFPGARLVLGGHRAELPAAYTPLFIVAPEREHLLEVRVAVGPGQGAGRRDVETRGPRGWELSDLERLVLVCLGRRYLGREPSPQPLTWAQVAGELAGLRPDERWSAKRAARVVNGVRRRLSTRVEGLLEEEVPPPIGNALNHNLIIELLVTATLVPADLALLDGPA
ncbi:FHA domain-containing protein [Actinomadura violacea]|uniref:FHA domain-containing protein n=1 Tax=Actinomadura violacea TaxID=2819934 RepID=A0ABS3RHZ6_9ACTN|nr:FHA domain-containing protein [Actinomadura violacea]MBO2456272.1 FHA domain-containing protein [Actinomadura violacea]